MRGCCAPALRLICVVAAGSALAQQPDPCLGSTTAEMRICGAQRLQAAEAEMQRYLEAARRVARPPSALDASQAAWIGYRDHACRAAAAQYEGGSLQPVVAIDCRLRLARERTLELWRAYLTAGDGLPEPLPAQ
jgi:uncharacterized protein YecT (DUF1311 family)